jgi:DNA-binding NarL/FixJ family response regulator
MAGPVAGHHASDVASACRPIMPLTIVVADDNLDSRLLIRTLLRSSPELTIVGEAADGEEAFALVRLHRPDILIADLVMPRLNGVELTKRIRGEFPETKIVLMSSFTEDAYRRSASESGADAFLSKRVIAGGLLPTILEIGRRGARGA